MARGQVERILSLDADGRDDVGARERGELDGEAPDAARGAGYEHASAEHRAEAPQRAQRGRGGGRQDRGVRELQAVGDDRELIGVDGHALGPSARAGERDHARATWRTRALRGRGLDDAGCVVARNVARGLELGQVRKLAEVQRGGVHRHDGLRRAR